MIVVGAGPYGLSVTAYLAAAGAPVRCFGEPLEFWRRHMPAGMILRSSRRATHLANPGRVLSIDRYESETGRTLRSPSLRLQEFVDYGTWFQERAVPGLDPRRIESVERASRSGRGFAVRLAGGEQIEASHVVVAGGLEPFANRPEPFRSLPAKLISHTSDHADLEQFAGRRVVVVGGGQSALEGAALLAERGATVEVLAKAPAIYWLPDDTQPGASNGRRRIPLPPTGVGGRVSGWAAAIPDAFRQMPRGAQRRVSERCLRPAGSGWLAPRLAGVTISCGRSAVAARAELEEVVLRLDDGSERVADHVMLGTGYDVEITRYPFLAPDLAARVDTVGGSPLLGPGLESSVPGLHFVGAPAVLSFGPVMRFVVGSWYAAPSVALSVVERRRPPIRFAF